MNIFTRYLIQLIPSRTIRRKIREPLRKDYLHQLIAEIWSTGRVSPEWLSLLSLLAQGRSPWNELNRDVWLMYAAALRKIGEVGKAALILERYVRHFGLARIELLLPLAEFAEQIGLVNPGISASSRAFRLLEGNLQAGVLADLLRGKSVAVVGNGPSEIGTGNGGRIDAHDLVIRFNNFKTEGFQKDYGSRTSVWVTSTGKDVSHDRSYADFEMTVIGPNLWHTFLSEEERAHLLETVQKTDRVVIFDPATQCELWEALDNCPSYGLVCIWSILRQNLTRLTEDDVFGFSFLQHTKQIYAEHYFRGESLAERKRRSGAHNFITESEFIEKLFRQNGE